jgi:integrase
MNWDFAVFPRHSFAFQNLPNQLLQLYFSCVRSERRFPSHSAECRTPGVNGVSNFGANQVMEKTERARIGVRNVKALTPHPSGATRVRLWDTEVKGFGVRVSASGRKTYVVKYEWRGKDQTFTIGEHGSPWTPSTARTRALEIVREAGAGEDPGQKKKEQRTALTVSDLIEKWLAEGPISRPQKREWSWQTDRSRLRGHAAPVIGRLLATEVKRRDIEFMQAEVARGATADKNKRKGKGRVRMTGGPLVAANVVQCVSAMFGWAMDQELVEHNPCLRVKRAKANKRVRFLNDEETRRLLNTLDQMERDKEINEAHLAVLRLLLLTGARKSEISELRWSEIDWERRCIFLPVERSKTGQRDPIRLAMPALNILLKWREKAGLDNPCVFPSQNGRGVTTAADNSWKVVRARAKLENFRLHDLRHNAASVAVNEGVSLYVAGKLLGHRNASTTERYAHVAHDPIHKAAEAVASRILSTAKPTPQATRSRCLPLTSQITVSMQMPVRHTLPRDESH